jgi:tetratricopeptide (TPR) repeat protein
LNRSPKKSKPGRPAKRPPSRARQWFFRLIALVVIPLFLLAATEAGLRLSGRGYDPGLFRKLAIGNSEFLVNNETFGLRFFPPQLTRGTSPIRMPVHKSAGAYRIFILGESAAMGDPEPSFGAGRYLEALLEARYPGAHFEIVNTGITAINSNVILPIARDCANAGGDLWIIYMGNNEMVGPFGAATVFGAKAPPLALVRLNLAIQNLRVGQLLVELARKLQGGNAAAPSWGGMEMFVGNQLRADDPRKEVVYDNFSRNLEDIVKTGLNSGVKILLNTVAVNLKDCAPFATMVNSNLPPAERAQFDQDFTNAVREQENGHFPDAVRDFGLAATIDPQVAELQFRWGQSLLKLTNSAAAREHLQMACDDDALPFRTDSRLNAIIAATGRKLANGNLVLFDTVAALAASAPFGLLGNETFFEHVHFNLDGNYQLGRAWAEQVAGMLPAEITRGSTNGWPSQSACDLRLGLSDWNRELVWKNVISRLEQPPLSGQLDNTARVNDLQSRLKALQARMDARDADQANTDFQAALLRAPEDFLLRANYAAFLQSSAGNLPSATLQWQQVHDLLP